MEKIYNKSDLQKNLQGNFRESFFLEGKEHEKIFKEIIEELGVTEIGFDKSKILKHIKGGKCSHCIFINKMKNTKEKLNQEFITTNDILKMKWKQNREMEEVVKRIEKKVKKNGDSERRFFKYCFMGFFC